MLNGFTVTYEIVTPESAEQGDAAERGFLDPDGATVAAIAGARTPGVTMGFRQALDLFNRERDWTAVEADAWPISREFPPRWFTDSGEIQFASGECRALSLHLPDGITASSAMRIARLLCCQGVRQ